VVHWFPSSCRSSYDLPPNSVVVVPDFVVVGPHFVAVDVGLKIELLRFLHFVKCEAPGGSPLFQWQYTVVILQHFKQNGNYYLFPNKIDTALNVLNGLVKFENCNKQEEHTMGCMTVSWHNMSLTISEPLNRRTQNEMAKRKTNKLWLVFNTNFSNISAI
jgi:hypothetical protein